VKGRGGAHPLEEFIRHTFGDPFSRIVMAGYGNAPGARLRPLSLPPDGGSGRKRFLELTGGNPPPSNNEPLVLAALLKLLLSRPKFHRELEFSTSELLTELGWEDTGLVQRGVDHTIEKYATLTYFRYEEGSERGAIDGLTGQWGYHSLVTGYSTETATPRERAQGRRLRNTVRFDEDFVRSLGEGRVIFAGVDFGALREVRGSGKA
jgi:hypothetical protein